MAPRLKVFSSLTPSLSFYKYSRYGKEGNYLASYLFVAVVDVDVEVSSMKYIDRATVVKNFNPFSQI